MLLQASLKRGLMRVGKKGLLCSGVVRSLGLGCWPSSGSRFLGGLVLFPRVVVLLGSPGFR